MADKLATYKGKTYRLLFLGPTKFGKRAKLGFIGGSEEFWVSGDLVQEKTGSAATTSSRRGGRRSCAECGRGGKLVHDLEDGLMKHYGCCDIPP